MELFWKRAPEQNEPISRRSDSDELSDEIPGAVHSSNCDAGWEIGNLRLAGETEDTTPAERSDQIDAPAVVDLVTDRRSRLKRGPIFWGWVAAAPLFGIGLVVSLANGSTVWAAVWVFALATVRLMANQAAMLDEERAALRNSGLDNRWIGPLCEALEWPDRRVKNVAGLLLAQFLPRLKEADAGLFTEEQLTCLYRRLTPLQAFRNPELALTILRALPYIGTEPALPYVERLARALPFPGKQKRVRDAALAVLALLEQRAAVQRSAGNSAGQSARADGSTVLPATAGTERSEAQIEEAAAMSALVDGQMREFEEELRKLQTPGMRVGFLIASWGIILPYAAVQTFLHFAGGNWLGGLIFGIFAILSTQLYRMTLTGRHKLLARKLARMDDVRCIGRLAELIEWPDATVRYVAIEALTRLLPRVRATDSVLSNARQRASLHRMLALGNVRQFSPLMLSILKALEQIGDASAVPFVEQLARSQPTSAQQRKVCDAARDCLEFLVIRAELSRSSQTLLRASSAADTGTESLLRPSCGVGVTDQQELLRAGASTSVDAETWG